MLVFICAIVAIIFLVHKYLSREYGYFETKGIPFSKPTFIVGSRKDFIFRNKSPLTVMRDFYNEFPNDKYECRAKRYVLIDEIENFD